MGERWSGLSDLAVSAGIRPQGVALGWDNGALSALEGGISRLFANRAGFISEYHSDFTIDRLTKVEELP